jgi:hypothetical protein
MEQAMIERLYAAFNARDLDAALAGMHGDVVWPNGMEGGYVYGREGVREYWTRQWGMINPRVDPKAIEADSTGRIVVQVHQVVRDLNGAVLLDHDVLHVYVIEDGLVRSMEIREANA